MDYFIFTLCVFMLAHSIFSFYQTKKLKQKFIEQDDAHEKALATAGNAITDTLKVAFEQLKKNNSDHSKINNKITELNSRLHRLEQQQIRVSRDAVKIGINSNKAQSKNFIKENKNENE